ncbi:hypothetical protein GcM1_244011 [Golovinomyces cichoracearum]|uniref:Uncharacterized protein n=1 Tax=Golovinomyces cichoracearum TaxID=62708 RepID=A0A420IFJ7_9PEZI|nr:hypothetical protein GcM1_244011 [Golovinomyces cichoracearum]
MPSLLSKNVLRQLKTGNFLSKPYREISTSCTSLQVRPEHPSYIDVPGQVPFQRLLRRRDIKGTLPPPRDVLKTRALRTPKNHPKFLLKTIPEPKAPKEAQNEFEAWKHRAAELRKRNLKESLVELHERKSRRKENLERMGIGGRNRRERLLNAPQREDERLTNPTVTLLNSKLQEGALPDPNRESRILEKAARVRAKEEAKTQERMDALHTLYMNARSFITTEKLLEARIQEIFKEEPFAMGNLDDNIWEVLGAPPTVRDLLKRYEGNSRVAMEAHQLPAVIIGERMQVIAEELTGGKMESESSTREPEPESE